MDSSCHSLFRLARHKRIQNLVGIGCLLKCLYVFADDLPTLEEVEKIFWDFGYVQQCLSFHIYCSNSKSFPANFLAIVIFRYNQGRMKRIAYRLMPSFSCKIFTEIIFSIGEALVIRDISTDLLFSYILLVCCNRFIGYLSEYNQRKRFFQFNSYYRRFRKTEGTALQPFATVYYHYGKNQHQNIIQE